MKNGWIAAGVVIALVACTQPDPSPPPATTADTGLEATSTQAGSSVPEPGPTPSLSTQSTTEAKRISVAEVQQKLANGTAVLVDVRDLQSFTFLRANGAISIPLPEVAARAGELPRDKQIVTYCT